MSLSPSNHQAKHFLSSPWPRFQLRIPQSTSVLAGLTSMLILVVCLSPAAPDLKLSFGYSCLCLLSFSLRSLFYILLVLRQMHASRLLSPCAAGNVIFLFSQISFVLPFFSWYYLSQSHSCDHSLFWQYFFREGIFPPIFHPSSPLLAFWCFFFIYFSVLSLWTAVSGFVWQLLSYLVLSGAG